MSVNAQEAVDNLRAMLAVDPARFGLMVQRQVQFALLPRLRGPRAALEAPLWSLLVLTVDGHDAAVPPLDDETLEDWLECAERGVTHSQNREAAFPRAASAVAASLRALREHGVLPVPKLAASK